MTFAFAIAMCILFGSMGRIVMKRALGRQSPLICSFYFAFSQAILAVPLFPFLYQSPSTFFYSTLSGFLFGISIYYYYASFEGGDVSLLAPLRGLRGVVALIISLLWWHEALSNLEMLGIVIIGLGILFLQRGSQFQKLVHFLFHKEALMMIFSVVLGVLSSNLDKTGATEYGIYTHYLLTSTSSLVTLGVIVLIRHRQHALKEVLTNLHPEVLVVGALFSVTFVFHLMALQIERVTIVNGLLPIGTLVTSLFASYFLKEKVQQRLLGTLVIVLGAIMMALT